MGFVISGFVVGVIVGMTGVGGGSLMTPLLVLVFGIQPASAVGTDLIYAAVTKTVGAGVHGFSRNIDWRITGLLAAGSVPASALTVWAIVAYGKANPHVASIITVTLGVALVLTALASFGKSYVQDYATRLAGGRENVFSPWLTVLVGVVLGVLVSMTSVGAGALGITALLFLYPKVPDRPAGRLGHRPCRAARLCRRVWPLADRVGAGEPARRAAFGLDPRHLDRLVAGAAHARLLAADGACRRSVDGGRTSRPRLIACRERGLG